MKRLSPLTTSTAPIAVLGSIALSLTAAPAATASQPLPADRSASPTALRATPGAPATIVSRRTPATHTVTRGDTVSAIAASHGLRTADVLAWNGLGWKSIIHPGDVLRLSADASPAKAKKAASASASRASSSYTVKNGDTLWAIARAKGVTLARLLRANDLTGGSIIYPGQRIRIPGTQQAEQKAAAKAAAKTKPAAASSPKDSPATAPKVALDAEQIAGAKTIIAVGRRLGVPDRGIAIALATAMVESWIRNLDHGTHDSVGLFQQRPSTGWGTIAQIQDPKRAAAAFFGGPSDPNGTDTRGLLDIPGWEDMTFGEAAQAVQRSAYPERYGPWESQAYAWLAAHG